MAPALRIHRRKAPGSATAGRRCSGGEVVDDLGGLVEVAHQDEPRVLERGIDDLTPPRPFERLLECRLDPLDDLADRE